jgi:hypothetical protein
MAEELIDSTILTEMASLERSIFHLDGPDALQHLPWLLSLPQLNAVQWVFGAGNGPAARWLDVYRRCLDAGKSVQVMAESPQDAIDVARALGHRGVWLRLDHEFATRAEGERFLSDIARMSVATSSSESKKQ